jgi:mannosyltransferase
VLAEPAPRSSRIVWALGALLALGLGLRLAHLGNGLWFDEVQTLVEYVRSPLTRIVSDYHSTNQHPLYSVLARLSILLLGESGAALRFPAALLGTASLWAFYRLASYVATRREALLGTALLTVSYHHVWFSQNARGYSGLLLFTLLATTALVRLLREHEAGWKPVAQYGAFTALAVYTHPTAVLAPVAHALVLLGVAWRTRRTRVVSFGPPIAAILLAAGLTLLLYLPMLSRVITTFTVGDPHTANTSWRSPLWLAMESARGLAAGLPGGWLAIAIGVLIAGTGLVSFWRESPSLVAVFLFPALLTTLTALAMHQNLWPRFFFFSAGFAVLIAVRGGFGLCSLLFGARGPLLATGGAILAIVASAFTVPRAWGPKQDFVGAEQYVDRVRGSADAVVTVDLTAYPYQRWLRRDWPAVESLSQLEGIEHERRLAGGRTWLLYTFPIRLAVVQPEIWNRLAAQYDTAAVFAGTVGGGAVVVMKSRVNSSSLR